MTLFIARCIWREDGSYSGPESLPDAWSLLDEEFYSREEAETAANEDRLQTMQQRGGWMGVHRIGLRRLEHRFFEADDFDAALTIARRQLSPDEVLLTGADDND
ncbi:MAG: hypothetical protein AVDCRST_MAG18-3133 [uncultured Thermomicrobiales bacterium]|uniref:Uncharacterized protein n=1 Tax=uncultured Thermomicrobiales bacterium TaxID=1645740 RepID=A0A6J4VK24_9BACT|nr:MAG: hypothetical protein AVDCRST_MAG18-3133 [uncultured Thermomicrobiales bacterium]